MSKLSIPHLNEVVAAALMRAGALVEVAGVTRSHHFGVAAYHLQPVAAAGMVGLAFGNSPTAMPA